MLMRAGAGSAPYTEYLMRAFLWPLLLALALAACDTPKERAENHYQRALALIDAGDQDRAMVELRNVLRLDDDHEPARLTYAGLLRDRGEVREAIRQLQRLTEQDPRSLAGHRALAELALEVQDFDAAEEHVAAAWALDPADPVTRGLKAAVDFRDPAHRDEAVAMARAVAAEAPTVVAAQIVLIADRVAADDQRGALGLVDAALAHVPDDEGLHLARIATLEALDDEAGIGVELARMAELFPDNAGVGAALVQWHLRAGDEAGAEAVLRETAARDPDPANTLTVVRFLLERRGPEAARAELDRLIAGADDPRPFRRARAGVDFAEGDREGAIAAMRGLLAGAEPSDSTRELQVGLAEMLAASGQTAESAALLGEVLAADRNQVEALKLRAKLAIGADDPDAAIQDMRTAQAQAPGDPEIMTITALAHERAGSRELAGEQLALAVEAARQAPAESLRYARFLMQEDRTGPAEGVLTDALRRTPDDQALVEALGRVHLARRDWARAAQVTRILRDQGGAAAALADGLEAASLQAQGRTAETVTLLESLAGSDGAAMAALVRTRVEAGDVAGAQGYLDGVLAQDPGNLSARLLRAGLAAVQGDAAAAEAGYEAVIADAPGLAPANRAYAAFLAGQGRAAEAMAALDAGLAAAPGDGELIFAKAGLSEMTGDRAGALKLYEELYARDSGSAVLANNLASLLTADGSDPAGLDRAWAVARRLRDAPVPQFQDTYGWILHLRGESAQALDYLVPAAEALPGNAEVQFHRGEAELAAGRSDEARASFERALTAAADGSPLPQADAVRARLAGPAEPAPGGG